MNSVVWNFRGHVAIGIETDARTLLSDKIDDNNFRDTIFSANNLQGGCFVEAMMFLLRYKLGYEYNEALEQFISDAGKYLGQQSSDIPEEISKSLFEKYRELLNGDTAL